MIQYLRRHKMFAAVSVFTLFLALSWLWSASAPIRGHIAARIDVHRGRYQVLGYGLAPPSRSEYAGCLRERYGIEFRTVAGCMVSDSLLSYVNAYHSVVTNAAYRKFRRDVFRECADEAYREWKIEESLRQPGPPRAQLP